jgi:hypothetical protein
MHENMTDNVSVDFVQNSSWNRSFLGTEKPGNVFIPCKVKMEEINLYIIIGVESLLLCAFIAATFYLYFNKSKNMDMERMENKPSNSTVTEEGIHYLSPSEPQLMHYETVISASRRSSINSENPYEIIVNNRGGADVRSLESNNNVLNRSYENITEGESIYKTEVPPSLIIDCKKLESVPVIIDGCTEVF